MINEAAPTLGNQFWIGTAVTTGLAAIAWSIGQFVNWIQGLKAENKKLREDDDKALRRSMVELSSDLAKTRNELTKELQLNILAVNRLDVKFSSIEKFGFMMNNLSEDVKMLKDWHQSKSSIGESSDS